MVLFIVEKKLREHVESSKTGKMSSQSDDSPYGELPNAHCSPSKSGGHAGDIRPREEYDEPWEWSQTHSMIFDQIGLPTEASAQPTRGTPLMTKRTNVPESKPPGLAEVVAQAEASVSSMSLALREEEESTASALPNEEEEEEEEGEEEEPAVQEVIEVVEEPEMEYENMKDDYDKPAKPPELDEEEYERYTHLRDEFPKVRQCPENDKRVGNYEEPWDLCSTQRDLEDRIKAHVSAAGTSGGTVSVNATTPSSNPETEPEVSNASGPMPDSDTRTQEGYEKPWDWKPHMKDDRGQDGYEKPWDWKPHQKDDRPQEEYEQPWDQKVLNIEQNILKAQNAKDVSGSSELSLSRLDTRPMEEYDEPWDNKRKALVSRTGE